MSTNMKISQIIAFYIADTENDVYVFCGDKKLLWECPNLKISIVVFVLCNEFHCKESY